MGTDSLQTNLSEKELLLSYLAEYVDGEIPTGLSHRYIQIMGTAENASLAGDFQKVKGFLQLSLQSIYLDENESAYIRNLVQDPQERATKEAQKIADFRRVEILSNIWRRFVILLIVAAIVGAIVYVLKPPRQEEFNALDYMRYEALAMEQDTKGRLLLPTNNLEEISDYFSHNPGLGFQPKILRDFSKDWVVEGATVIDYGGKMPKVAVAQYYNKSLEERLFHFSYQGKLTDLPKSEPGNYRGLLYQTYSDGNVNIIAWQQQENVVSLFIGRRSAPELAGLIRMGIGD